MALLQKDGLLFLYLFELTINNTNTYARFVDDDTGTLPTSQKFQSNNLCYLQSRSLNMLSCAGTVGPSGNTVLPALGSLSSAATAPREHSFYTLFSSISSIVRLRRRRSTLTRFNPGHALPQVRLFPERSFNSHVATCHEVYCIICTEASFYDCLSSELVCKRIYALSLCLCG